MVYRTYTKDRTGVRYVDLDAIDFEKRDWVPYSGWPITKEDLIPFYKRAHEFCSWALMIIQRSHGKLKILRGWLTKDDDITSIDVQVWAQQYLLPRNIGVK